MMQTKEKPPVVDNLYDAYLKAGGKPEEHSKDAFISGMQAGLWFFEVLKDEFNDPMEAVKAFMEFRAEVRKEWEKTDVSKTKIPTQNKNN